MTSTLPMLHRRDQLLDAIRGFALMIIVIDHQNPNIVAHFTPQVFGFSDMLDVFVATSGISCGIAYSRRMARDGFWITQRRAWERTVWLYVVYLLTMLAIVPLTWLYADTRVTLEGFLNPDSDMVNLWKIVSMTHSWGALPILKLYMIYVVLTPVLLKVCQKSRKSLVGLSFVVYLSVQCYTLFTGHTWSGDPLFVDPWAWQLLFVGGLATGAFRTDWKLPICRHPWIALAAAAMLQVSFVMKVLFPGYIPGASNVELGPLRVIHICSLMIVAMFIESKPWGQLLLKTPPMQAMQLLGRNSLLSFCIGEVVVGVANCYVKASQYSTSSQIVASLAAVSVMCILTWLFSEWPRRRRQTQIVDSRPVSLEAIEATMIH